MNFINENEEIDDGDLGIQQTSYTSYRSSCKSINDGSSTYDYRQNFPKDSPIPTISTASFAKKEVQSIVDANILMQLLPLKERASIVDIKNFSTTSVKESSDIPNSNPPKHGEVYTLGEGTKQGNDPFSFPAIISSIDPKSAGSAGVPSMTCRFLVDTGSDVSFVSLPFLETMDQKVVKRPLPAQEVKFYSTVGNKVCPTHYVIIWCKFDVDEEWEWHRFTVMESMTEAKICLNGKFAQEKGWIVTKFPQSEVCTDPRPAASLGAWLDESNKDLAEEEARRKHDQRQNLGVAKAREFLQSSPSSSGSSTASDGTGRSSNAITSSSCTEFSSLSISNEVSSSTGTSKK